MAAARPEQAWLDQVRHDLVKRLLWPARDRRDLGGKVVPGELRVALLDEEGRLVTAAALWQSLAGRAPPSLPAPARESFARAVASAERGADRDELAQVLLLESAYEALARAVKGEG
jgi:hypothetical protein